MSRKQELIDRFESGESLSSLPSFYYKYEDYRELTEEFGLTFRPINDNNVFVIYNDDLTKEFSEFEYIDKCYLDYRMWQTENSINFLQFVDDYDMYQFELVKDFLSNINLRKDYKTLIQNVDWLEEKIDTDSTEDFKLHELVATQNYNEIENPPKNSSDATNIIRAIDLPYNKIVELVDKFNLDVDLILNMGFYSTRNVLSLRMISNIKENENNEEEID